jgi:ABC-type glycerol-3-phosphate transport system substrate-binding protein
MEENLSITALSAVLLLLFAGIQISSCAIVTDPYANISTSLRESMRNQHLGVTINVHLLKFQENFMLEKMKNFEILTGVSIQKISSTTDTWYDDVLVDIRDNSPGFIDLYASFGNWIPQYAELNGLKDLTNETRNAVGLDWFDIMVSFRVHYLTFVRQISHLY